MDNTISASRNGGKFKLRIERPDPVLAGLPPVFEIMESHVGQIAYVPDGWQRIVTRGPGAHTLNQCLRVKDRLIYAAQFHIELPGTERNSRLIMGNFLGLAKRWGGYNPEGSLSAMGNQADAMIWMLNVRADGRR